MSHRHPKERSSKRSGGGGGTQYPTVWSEWQWNDSYKCDVRYRLSAPNEYEYQYGPRTPEVPRYTSNILNAIPEQQYAPQVSQDNYTTQTASVETITRGLASASILPSTSQQPQASQAYGSYAAPTSSAVQAHIVTRNPNTYEEKFDPHYKVHNGREFKWGRVFKVLWSEPAGNNGSNAGGSEWSVRSGRHGEKVHEKVRRFVVIDARDGHCLCLPIMTYGGQGTNKNGVHAKDHAIIWTEKPVRFKGEQERGLTKSPIRVDPYSKRHKLDEASRLNYAKLYTVEYNVKVWFIGKIHEKSEYQLTTDYNLVHPPMPPRGPPPSSEDTYGYAGGGIDIYQAPYSSYTAPATSYSTSTVGYTATAAGSAQQSNPTSSTAYSPNEYAASTIAYSDAQTAPSYQTTAYETAYTPSYQVEDHEPDARSAYDKEKYYD